MIGLYYLLWLSLALHFPHCRKPNEIQTNKHIQRKREREENQRKKSFYSVLAAIECASGNTKYITSEKERKAERNTKNE